MIARDHAPKPEPTAAETYAARRSDIARLHDVLEMELDKHAAAQQADPRTGASRGASGRSAAI